MLFPYYNNSSNDERISQSYESCEAVRFLRFLHFLRFRTVKNKIKVGAKIEDSFMKFCVLLYFPNLYLMKKYLFKNIGFIRVLPL